MKGVNAWCRDVRRVVYRGLPCCVLAVVAARAEVNFDPYAGIVAEHNSNLFSVPDQNAVVDPKGNKTLADTTTSYLAGAVASFLYGRQELLATVEGRRSLYNEFTDLDHNEYLVDLGYKWKLFRTLDGLLDARESRQIVNFVERTTTILTLQTDKAVKGTLNAHVTSDWLLEAGLATHRLDSPLLDPPLAYAPDFSLRETTESAGLKYVGVANLAYGLEISHVEGVYSGDPGAVDYNQNTAQLAAKYNVSGLTTLNAAAGYTRRLLQDNGGTVSGATGLLGYSRQLTGKTSVNLQFSRLLNSYYNAGSSEIDTGGSAGALWQATPKLSVALNYQRVHSQFLGQTLPNANIQGRVDTFNFASMDVIFQPRLWLSIHPYVKYQKRDSNLENLFSFTGTLYGLEVRIKKPTPNRGP